MCLKDVGCNTFWKSVSLVVKLSRKSMASSALLAMLPDPVDANLADSLNGSNQAKQHQKPAKKRKTCQSGVSACSSGSSGSSGAINQTLIGRYRAGRPPYGSSTLFHHTNQPWSRNAGPCAWAQAAHASVDVLAAWKKPCPCMVEPHKSQSTSLHFSRTCMTLCFTALSTALSGGSCAAPHS